MEIAVIDVVALWGSAVRLQVHTFSQRARRLANSLVSWAKPRAGPPGARRTNAKHMRQRVEKLCVEGGQLVSAVDA
ncbi:MAG: hypothetical protein H6718_08420 [Polyangiaceae bacterium]|nr:hypothetical protein [Myxococcales bacterium]MCB9585409.1 hypothetical protein [Polyangiaceae bacterium]MCB9606575.1 hypothetical protein [Polyangiaceae bacterium]